MKPVPLYSPIVGPRGQKIRRRSYGGGGNRLIPSATQTDKRKWIPFLDEDACRNVTALGRRVLVSQARRIAMSCAAIGGAVRDMAALTASNFCLEYRGESKLFKTKVEDLLYDHDMWCDVEGPTWNMLEWRLSLMLVPWIDGDQGTIFVERDGLPYLQVIPSHRICSDREFVDGGPYDGSRINDGVIIDDFNRPVAYRVLTGLDRDMASYVDVPADSMKLSFVPLFRGQLRGWPLLGITAWYSQDLNESQRFELLAQKAGAGRMFQEWTEAGEIEPGNDFNTGPDTGTDSTSTPSGLWREEIDEGINTTFKAMSGERIEAIKFDRPSSDQQAFAERVQRENFTGNGLSYDLLFDAAKLGGAPLRVVVDKINSSRDLLIRRLLEPACRWFDLRRIATFDKAGWIKAPADFYKIEYQGPAKLTADRKYDADVASIEIRTGVTTRSRRAMELGETLPDVRMIKTKEVEEILDSADDISMRKKWPRETVLAMLENDSMNGQVQAPQAAEGDGEGDANTDLEATKAEVDAYGVAVRAGAVTPSVEDENHFRAKLGLPPLSSDAKSAWGKEDNIRRPITLTPPPGAAPKAGFGQPSAPPVEDEE